MKLYERCMAGVSEVLSSGVTRALDVNHVSWEDVGNSQLIFQEDMAYELGGNDTASVSGIFYTQNAVTSYAESSIEKDRDEIVLIGPDLPEISDNHCYGRLVFVQLDEAESESTERFYQLLRAIEYRRYHVNPDGFMMRISTMDQKETVRVSKEALARGLDFAKVGKLMLEEYHKLPQVKAVKIVFITDSTIDFEALARYVKQSEDITKALDHLLHEVNMDCKSCGLKEICEEVQEMCEMVH